MVHSITVIDKLLKKHRIRRLIAYTPEQNGFAKRKNCTLIEAAR